MKNKNAIILTIHRPMHAHVNNSLDLHVGLLNVRMLISRLLK